jgi:hypothetical protein
MSPHVFQTYLMNAEPLGEAFTALRRERTLRNEGGRKGGRDRAKEGNNFEDEKNEMMLAAA